MPESRQPSLSPMSSLPSPTPDAMARVVAFTPSTTLRPLHGGAKPRARSPALLELVAELEWLEREHPTAFEAVRRLGHQLACDRRMTRPDSVRSE